MLKTFAFLAAGALAGVAVSAFWGGSGELEPADALRSQALPERVTALEAALEDSRRERIELKRQVESLRAALAAPPPGAPVLETRVERPAASSADSEGDAPAPPPQSRRVRAGPSGFGIDDAELVDRFVAAGIASDRAQWIVDRLAAVRMEALQAQYDAAREGRPLDAAARLSARDVLREELGMADYEKYLEALGRPTDVDIREVIPSSPAAQAGLMPGDRVVAYGGARVFDIGDLNRLTLEGEPGQTVAVDVIRDGQPIQLYIPRGPMGITGGRFGPGAGRGGAR
jgi:membrane-associated protease RseP (regulator of RpoE activity)